MKLFLETIRDLFTYTVGFLVGWFLAKSARSYGKDQGHGTAPKAPAPKNKPGTGSVLLPKQDKTDDLLGRLNGK